jgi:DNA-binding GntR family transcriptional regulator
MWVERRGLVDGAYEGLKELILDQRVAPGEHLNIDALAAQMGVSQTPIREALARLEAEGLVVKMPRRGRYLVAPMLDGDAFDHLYEVRLLLEPRAAALTVSRLDDGVLAGLDRALAGMQTGPRGGTYREYRDFSTQDAAFHRALAVGSGNPILADAIVRLRSHHQLARLYRDRGVDADEGIAEHELILEALRHRDARGAERAMRAHIGGSHDRLRHFLASGVNGERVGEVSRNSTRVSG